MAAGTGAHPEPHPESHPESVGYTASWMAAARAMESRRPDAILDDPWAESLAGVEGGRLLAHFHGEHTETGHPALAIRHRWFDQWLTDSVRPGDQVVGLGTGLETRPWRLPWPDGVRMWQLDRPTVLERRSRVMAGVEPRCPVTAVGAGLDEDWPAALREAGHDPAQRTVWYVEGVLFYLPEVVARSVLASAAAASAPGSALAVDLVDPDVFAFPGMRTLLARLAAAGSPWQFATAAPAQVVEDAGWRVGDVVEPGSPGADFGRWPAAWALDAVTERPHTYLVHGVRG